MKEYHYFYIHEIDATSFHDRLNKFLTGLNIAEYMIEDILSHGVFHCTIIYSRTLKIAEMGKRIEKR